MAVKILSRAECPLCKSEIEIGLGGEKGSRMSCLHCRASLELIALNPPEYRLAYDTPEMAEQFLAIHRTVWNDWW